ncbi:uncharacterized protein LOC113240452 [Hyposmocoma kahamanoa]|uniref:uncharacterized protein LOC113240452 n=1 Tax=Hyposmocoma kahamanoa TaxID=1477025 RepID=UPI000E6D9CC3|nr:uncharacterized protein LOC113240452 [Hyposmocoma kahamanoa]
MDNASYHTVRKNKAPTTANLKTELKEWLNSNNIHFQEYHTKARLLCLVHKHNPDSVYEADELLRTNGHEVLRLPPNHCELNPIELIWSLAKRKVAKKNINLSAADTEKLISECFASITAEEWKKMTDHVVHVENKYKERDHITENEKVWEKVKHVSLKNRCWLNFWTVTSIMILK